MTTGRPDYFRGVDVTYQTLAQITNRPKYGGALVSSGGVVVTANAAKELVSVSGKGMLYGGVLSLSHTASQSTGIARLTIDDNIITTSSFDTLKSQGVRKPRMQALYLEKFDNVNFIYSVGVSYGVTFEESFKLEYVEQVGGAPLANYEILYAVI